MKSLLVQPFSLSFPKSCFCLTRVPFRFRGLAFSPITLNLGVKTLVEVFLLPLAIAQYDHDFPFFFLVDPKLSFVLRRVRGTPHSDERATPQCWYFISLAISAG